MAWKRRDFGPGARPADQPRLHLRHRPRSVHAVLRRSVRDGTDPDADVRAARPVAARRRHATPSLLRGAAAGPAPPPRADDRRLRRRLPCREGTDVGGVGLAARRAPVGPGPALLPRSGRQPDRAELARRRDARPVALSGAAAARRRDPAERGLRSGRPLPGGSRLMAAVAAQRVRLTALSAHMRLALYAVLILVFVVFPLVWILFLAPTTGTGATTFGSAVHDPKDFLITLLNGITAAGLYFVVASGFTLIFGLMRVVNMAHGAFFLLGGYIALKLQRQLVGQGSVFGLTSD